jgi:hypothetical protein
MFYGCFSGALRADLDRRARVWHTPTVRAVARPPCARATPQLNLQQTRQRAAYFPRLTYLYLVGTTSGTMSYAKKRTQPSRNERIL